MSDLIQNIWKSSQVRWKLKTDTWLIILNINISNKFNFWRFMESWILRVSCKVNVKHFGLHLLCTRPEVFMIPWTFQKLNLFLKYIKQSFKIFATVHSLMNDINLIDSCQTHLPMQYALNIEFICKKWHWCCNWQRATPEMHVQNKLLVGSIGCLCSSWLSCF